jgi:hypothetical protein
VDVSRPLLPSKTYYLTPDVSPLLHVKIEMAYDDVFPSLARPPKNVQRQMDGSLPLSKISNYIMNVFCLVFSKPTEINVMFGLFPTLLHVFSMCFSGLLFSLKQRGFIEHGALFPKIQSPVANVCAGLLLLNFL